MTRRSLADDFQAAHRLHVQGKLDDAQRRYRSVLSNDPRHFEARFFLGVVRLQQERFADAARELKIATEIRPSDSNSWTNRGFAELRVGDKAGALASFDKVVALKPNLALAHSNRGNILRELNRPDEALLSYDRALALDPAFSDAHNNRGSSLMEMQQFEAALECFDTALELQPDHAEALNNRGNALLQLRRPDEAVAAYGRAIQLKPNSEALHLHRGVALKHCLRVYEAIDDFERALKLNPDFPDPASELVSVLGQICDWRVPHPKVQALIDQSSFRNLSLRDDPARHLKVAVEQVRKLMPEASSVLWRPHPAHDKIRLGYLSADFGDHVVTVLTSEIFELHDRGRFEVVGFAANSHTESASRTRLKNAFDRFIDVSKTSDVALAQRIADEEIDILVDLGGHTDNSRMMALAFRPAPIQLSYLGYPAATGAPFIDYTFADVNAIPESIAGTFTEKLAYLPDTFQPNDRARALAERSPTRAELGLPERGFVFCCFNNYYKLNPSSFDVWMRMLQAIPASVLWLIAFNDYAMDNIKKEARARGVDPSRLVFADRIAVADNLARLRLADLFLDTWPYNAGATASDALWAGLPVLTYAGRGFTARMACSLLHAIGMPELVTYSIADYEARGLRLATHPVELKALRDRLARNRDTYPLFDTPRLVRHMEAAYESMWKIHQAGEPPRTFHVAPTSAPHRKP